MFWFFCVKRTAKYNRTKIVRIPFRWAFIRYARARFVRAYREYRPANPLISFKFYSVYTCRLHDSSVLFCCSFAGAFSAPMHKTKKMCFSVIY